MLEHYTQLPVASYYRKDHLAGEKFFDPARKAGHFVNFGCGRAESLVDYPNAVGVDFNPNLPALWTGIGVVSRCYCQPADEFWMEWPIHTFGYSISMDFLEHVQPDQIAPVLKSMKWLAPRGRHIIDLNQESRFRGPAGENLHPSANTVEFWRGAFAGAIGGVDVRQDPKRRSLCLVSW